MPLPHSNIAWPPATLNDITPRLAEWSAWYEGSAESLRKTYSRQQTTLARPSQYAGGVVGAISRMWWGRPVTDLTKRQDQLHVPIASDLCQASADLLFSEPPTLKVADPKSNKRTQDALDDATNDGLLSTLAEAAEITAALGSGYLRVTWDKTISDRSFLTSVHADAAVPEFRWGHLVAVTFWRDVHVDGQTVYRHLERHELDGNGTGVILHGLYQGTPENLGRLIPLTEHTSTHALAAEVDADGAISTESPGLAVEFVPNQRPQRRWRRHPIGVNLGRSDLDGVESLMDALDETYSSWMRDVRLAKGRVIAPAYMLTNLGSGKGAVFDTEQEVFTPINMPPREDAKNELTSVQFEIRVAQHQATAQQLVEDILRTVGYSKQTFGEGTDGAAMTATEVTAKERRSYMTRDRKIRLWRPAVSAVMAKKLAVDKAIFRAAVEPERPVVDFGDAVQADPEALARTNDMLFRAQAASTETRVRLQHPDWDEDTVAEETGRILAEFSVAVPDPVGFNPATGAGSPVA